jgi:hypothetical protein
MYPSSPSVPLYDRGTKNLQAAPERFFNEFQILAFSPAANELDNQLILL